MMNDRLLHGVLALALCSSGVARSFAAELGPSRLNSKGELVASRPGRGEPLVPMHGLAIQIHRAENAVERISPAIRQVAALGANSVTLSINGYQEHAATSRIWNDGQLTPDLQQVESLVRTARESGLRVIFMPKILLRDPRGNEWRGRIQPPNWDDWFESYRQFIVEWARVAESAQADLFMVGSELVSTEKKTEQWARIIRDIRLVFAGQLAYSANWDHYSGIEFWHKVDLIGLTTYYKLSETEMPTVENLTEAWRPIREKILAFQERVDKPILLTEVGWASQPGCSIEPWNYFRNKRATPEGREEQRRCYEAFTRAWVGVPQVAGTIWWEWTPEPGGNADHGYTPKNKPAEQVLRKWLAEQAREILPPEAPTFDRP